MIQQSKAKIFLSQERGVQQTPESRQYCIFNTDSFYNEYREAMSNLYLFNDTALAGNALVKKTIKENSCIVVIPVVGTIISIDMPGTESYIHAGQMQFIYVPAGNKIEFQNPYADELVSFLLIGIKITEKDIYASSKTFSFNVDKEKNKLCEIRNTLAATTEEQFIAIGKFNGREEAIYKMKQRQNSLFVFVLEGVFEVQGRLLHEKDALALWEVNEAELEALSNNAIILLMEVKGN